MANLESKNVPTHPSSDPHEPSPVHPEQHAFIPEHLPEHERNLLHNPNEAHEQSRWLIPYLRAGSEAVKRTGRPDAFWGGDDVYENQLKALKHFYHGNQQSQTAPEAPVGEEAPVARKHGGPVSKQLNSIHDTFQAKLQDKERMISSLEKALERKPNTKLSKRLIKEKAEVERIKAHLSRVRSYAA